MTILSGIQIASSVPIILSISLVPWKGFYQLGKTIVETRAAVNSPDAALVAEYTLEFLATMNDVCPLPIEISMGEWETLLSL